MEATAGVAEPLGEQPLDETVDVFVRTIHKRGIFLPAIEDVGERRFEFARLIACKDAMPDLWDLADGLHDALGELRKAVARETATA